VANKYARVEKNHTYAVKNMHILSAISPDNLHIPTFLGKERKNARCVLDTGSNVNLVRRAALPPECKITEKTTPVCAASPSFPLTYYGNAFVTFSINNETYVEKVKVIEEISNDLLLGMRFIRKHGIVIDGENGKIRFKNNTVINIDKEYLEKINSTLDVNNVFNIILENDIKIQKPITIPARGSKTFYLPSTNTKYRTAKQLLCRGIYTTTHHNKECTVFQINNSRSVHKVLHTSTKICEAYSDPETTYNIHQ
jgi:hypothetical protein